MNEPTFIQLNNRPYPFKDGATIRSLMEENNYDFPSLIVKVNSVLIDENEWSSKTVAANDNVEIIHIFGGG